MKKTILLFLLCLKVCWSYSQRITEQEALDRALQYMSTSMNTGMRAPSRGGGAKPESAPVEAGSIYAFNLDGGGYIIASADSRALPVLGYSTTGSMDWENLPPNMKEWLKSYDEALATLGDQMDFLDGNKLGDTGQTLHNTRKDKAPVEPLISTHWDQEEPYWDMVPLYDGYDDDLKGQHCYAGCVAVSMAQVMNYYKWPLTVPDGLPAYDEEWSAKRGDKIWHIDALPPVAFDWDNMLDDYAVVDPKTQDLTEQLGTEAQRKAVATLMRYCGQAIEMSYSPEGSGAYTEILAEKLACYFDYPSPLYLRNNGSFSIEEWEDIIYSELAAGRPVIYGGFSHNGGHSFVCDGYDGNGLFHINWGWSGRADGYFSLSVLNPYITNSKVMHIGFCINQDAIIYLDPKMEKTADLSFFQEEIAHDNYPSLQDRDSIKISFTCNRDDVNKLTADCALGTVDSNGQLNPLFMVDPNDSIIYPSNVMWVKIDSTYFQPGDTITLYPMLRYRLPEAEWHVIPPLSHYIETGRDADGKFFVDIYNSIQNIECVGGSITKGAKHLDKKGIITVYVRNLSNISTYCDLYLTPRYYGNIDPSEINDYTAHSGDRMRSGAYLRSGQVSEVNFYFVPSSGGTTLFQLSTSKYSGIIGSFILELNNDTLADYSKYVVNNSYFNIEDGEWYYNVELCDTDFDEMSYWIPSDSLGLKINTYYNGSQVSSRIIRDELIEYLTELPDEGGFGDYTFVREVPIEIMGSGEYSMESYIGKCIGDSLTDIYCKHSYSFLYSDPTGIGPVSPAKASGPYYDLMGRKINGTPRRKGLLIEGNNKVYIK